MRVIFVLPGRGGGGGAHSVVQESQGLRRLGVDVSIATTRDTFSAFSATYPELEQLRIRTPLFRDDKELASILEGCDLAVATTAPSANQLAAVLSGMTDRKPKAAYYIQDYEPLFFTPGSPEWASSRASYTALPDALLMANTDWLCTMVAENHNRPVVKIAPSIDHATYHPQNRTASDRISIAAMVRPKTPRRAPRRTVRVLERLAAEFGEQVEVNAFGCERADLDLAGLRLSERINHSGVLSRRQVAAVLRNSDLFLDLSDFQAFGRTGLEGMACGCVPVLPLFGGAWEYALHRENAYLVDPRSDEAVVTAVREYIDSSPAARAAMRRKAIATSLNYSIERAAFSEFEVFSDYIG